MMVREIVCLAAGVAFINIAGFSETQIPGRINERAVAGSIQDLLAVLLGKATSV
jgi:hypothetical protein